jgi:transcriptional regulator with XRE-family HTH domain
MSELEERWRDLGEFIREQRRVGHLSLRKLSEMAGISNPYLSQIERGLRKPSAEILQQIARALEISSETLYVRAGILEAREGETDLIAEIRADAWLSEEQKRTLVQIYETFRAERIAAGYGPPPEPERLVDAEADLDADVDVDPELAGEAGDPGATAAADPTTDDDDSGEDEESEALAGRS